MGFKARKTYKSKGWLPAGEDTVDKIVNEAGAHPGDLLFSRKEWTAVQGSELPPRRVEATVTIEVKEISK